MKTRRLHALAVAMSVALAGCVDLAPHYQRPAAPVPDHWPAVDGAVAAVGGKGGAPADVQWRAFFTDPRLRQVVAQALDNNRDLRVAALDIEKERAEYRIAGSDLFPTIDATASGVAERTSASASGTGYSVLSREYSVELGFSSYELDVFGKLRNQKKEALETFFSDVETRRSTQISLVAEVATDWLTMASDRQLLKLARDTLASEQATFELVKREHDLGVVSGTDLAEAQSAVESARLDVGTYVTDVAQDRNALDLVVGKVVPDALLPGDDEGTASALSALPAGLPSSLLAQRPDVLAAEHTLKAANADIGAARANFFPSITLTAADGSVSDSLHGLFKSGTHGWTFEPSISLPIFDAGNNRATLDAAKVQRDIDVADYEKTIQTAFEEVANALAARATLADRMEAARSLVEADRKSYELTEASYRQGASSYLDVLVTQRTYYTAREQLISLQLAEQTNRVALYKVLGGGWN